MYDGELRFDIGIQTTKGAMVGDCEDMATMGLYCASTQSGVWSSETLFEQYENEPLEYDLQSNEWLSDGEKLKWSATSLSDNYTFLAYSPFGGDDNGIVPTVESGALVVSYTVPTECLNQPDLVLATPQKDISPEDGECVSLNFYHALAAIGFGVKGIASDIVQRVVINNVVPSGSVTISDGGEIEWIDLADRSTLEYSAGIESSVEPDIYSSTGLTSESGYLMMIPQSIYNVTIEVTVLNSDSGEERTERFGFGYHDEWVAGQIYQYTVNLSSYDYNVEGSSNCYMLHPSGKEQVYYIPVEGRINTFWWDYVGHTDKISSSNEWTPYVIWYEVDDESDMSGFSVERVTSGFSPSEKVTPECAPDFTTIGCRSAMKITLPAGFTEGNILIGVEYETQLLWSWHLWVTDYDPDSIVANSEAQRGQIVYSTSGVEGEVHRYTDDGVWCDIYEDKFIMDRNLGARDTEYDSGGAGVLHYQFGRKDPFPISCSVGIKTDNSRVSFSTAVGNPTTFYTQTNSPYSWSNEGIEYESSYLWDDKYVVNDGSASPKTFFDPSPLGWQIPQYGTYEVLDDSNCRYSSRQNLIIYESSANFPMTGYRSNYSGDVNDYGDQGNLRLSTPKSSSSAYNLVYKSNIEDGTNTRADGFCIRCIKE